jgi:hypothetical protein
MNSNDQCQQGMPIDWRFPVASGETVNGRQEADGIDRDNDPIRQCFRYLFYTLGLPETNVAVGVQIEVMFPS